MDFHGTYDGIFSLNFFVQHGLLVDKNSFVHLLEAGGMNLSVLGLQRRTNSPSRNGLPASKMWSFHMVGSWWLFSSTGSEPCHHPLLCQEGPRLCCPPGRCGFCPTRCCCHCLHMTKQHPTVHPDMERDYTEKELRMMSATTLINKLLWHAEHAE